MNSEGVIGKRSATNSLSAVPLPGCRRRPNLRLGASCLGFHPASTKPSLRDSGQLPCLDSVLYKIGVIIMPSSDL